ncbi:hypothetical protein [Natrinema halophilum]|uniref:Uncharacterized protein n=1 Tax=Natrinema halophilum TaxID=1699371 RepID=A0A7D5GI69_9EURY|nr:hypothetical protein [Natrinema halophilum]QLG49648.1 hypothetical protein HYG82_12635 [Natrinema halophilum]
MRTHVADPYSLARGAVAISLSDNLISKTKISPRETKYVFDPATDTTSFATFVYVEGVRVNDAVESPLGGHAVAVELEAKPTSYGALSGIQPQQRNGTYQIL